MFCFQFAYGQKSSINKDIVWWNGKDLTTHIDSIMLLDSNGNMKAVKRSKGDIVPLTTFYYLDVQDSVLGDCWIRHDTVMPITLAIMRHCIEDTVKANTSKLLLFLTDTGNLTKPPIDTSAGIHIINSLYFYAGYHVISMKGYSVTPQYIMRKYYYAKPPSAITLTKIKTIT